uniref:Uncharacterized protein n=1 Tax=Oryza glaberrima TaxID=4538 RepID=I1QJ05_ORYGL
INHEYGFLQSSVGETNILIGCRVWLHEVDATSLDGEQVIGFHSETPDLADKEGAVVKASDRDKHLVHGVHLVLPVHGFALPEVVQNWNGCSHHDDVHIAGLLNNLVAFFLDTNEDNGEDGSMVGEMHLIEDRCQIHKVAGKVVNTINGEFVVATSMTSSAWMSSLEWATLRMKGVEHAGLMGWRHLQDHDKANGHVGDEERVALGRGEGRRRRGYAARVARRCAGTTLARRRGTSTAARHMQLRGKKSSSKVKKRMCLLIENVH